MVFIRERIKSKLLVDTLKQRSVSEEEKIINDQRNLE